MEAFISLFLGLYPSSAGLTGIPMFPETTVSDCVFTTLIWKVLRASVFLQTGCCETLSARLGREKSYLGGRRTSGSAVSSPVGRSDCVELQGVASWAIAQLRTSSRPCGRRACSTAPFPNELTRNRVFRYSCRCSSGGLNPTGKVGR